MSIALIGTPAGFAVAAVAGDNRCLRVNLVGLTRSSR